MKNIIQFNLFNTEIPEGFTAKSKDDIPERTGARRNKNICHWCDARELCKSNENKWCIRYPCMSYRRNDRKSIYFKRASTILGNQ
jgi:hypothetical protein